jgi:hypothetical protein
MTMKLYRVAPLPEKEILVIAPTTTKAVEVFIARTGLIHLRDNKLVIERLDERMMGEGRGNLSEVLARGVAGVVGYDDTSGWFVEPTG